MRQASFVRAFLPAALLVLGGLASPSTAHALVCGGVSVKDEGPILLPTVGLFTGTVKRVTATTVVVTVHEWFHGRGAAPEVTLMYRPGSGDDYLKFEEDASYFFDSHQGAGNARRGFYGDCSLTRLLSSPDGIRFRRDAYRVFGSPTIFSLPETDVAAASASEPRNAAPFLLATALASVLISGCFRRRVGRQRHDAACSAPIGGAP